MSDRGSQRCGGATVAALLALVLGACGDGGGGGDGGTTTTAGSGGTTGGMTSGATSGGNPCSDNQDGNATPAQAHPLDFDAGGGVLSVDGVVCPTESDWFLVEAPCPGFDEISTSCSAIGAFDARMWVTRTGLGADAMAFTC